MYNVITHIDIVQVTPYRDSNGNIVERNDVIQIPFCVAFNVNRSWQNLTQQATVTLPKNAKYKTQSGKKIILSNTNANLGGFSKTPLFMAGDMISIYAGYRAKLSDGTWNSEMPLIFKGFISMVNPALPFTLKCEDAMWLCKQIATPSKTWSDSYTIGNIVKSIIADSANSDLLKRYSLIKLSVDELTDTLIKFNVHNLQTTRGSLAMFLGRLKTQYKVDSYFRDYALRIGLTHYKTDEAVEHTFTFQKNIVSNNLSWQRKDDTIMSCIVKTQYLTTESLGTTFDGVGKTKHGTTEILVFNYKTKTSDGFDYVVRKRGEEFPQNDIGERYTLIFHSPVTDPKILFEAGKEYLKKRYYDGFKGGFTVFGLPYVKDGDNVTLVDNLLPERNGKYKVKSVTQRFSVDEGLRQDIEIDYKI